jgi:hypothetical protein
MDAYEQEKADRSIYERLRREQCEAFITDIRKIRDEYQECMNAAYSRCEYRLGYAYSDIADDLNTALALVGENTRDPDE